MAQQSDQVSAIGPETVTSEAEQLSNLIGEIYDAALDPVQWRHVICKASRFVGCAPTLAPKDGAGESSNVYYLDDGASQLFRQLDSSTALASAICPQRDDDSDARRRLRAIVPHLRRAMQIGRTVDLKTSEAATFTDTLDGLNAGIALIDANGGVVHANTSFRALLSASDSLCEIGGKLVATDTATEQSLREALSAASCHDAANGPHAIALPLLANDGSLHVAHVLPLSSAGHASRLTTTAVTALIVHRTEPLTLSQPQMLARHYKLTATELRVLLAIVDVGGVPEVAASLGIAYSTAKTHLSNLFEKTGTRRQADLVKIVARFATPFVDTARRDIRLPTELCE
ncbi:helix-turn-helix transcriptional regulator [Bradyrhizobium prioriisuperbiae]|uniref:helix-turn-helix transcriptional regulator n=1 Tax=Bradyrhizobium prioriisuperbiae TaxID=2854389 RepID=UPI0028EC7597|nr:helix-turn-helix transcriptional regulator [Bradyrhizobium prioritasuperba]